MKIFLISVCLVLANKFAFGQTGFFLVVETKDQCFQTVVSLDEKNKFCITEEAVIKDSEFKVDGGILFTDLTQTDQNFNIRFSDNGLESLKLICQHLPEKRLILVVKGKVAGIYENKKLKPIQKMPITGKTNSKELKWVFENLKNRN
jgi:hypothetical protein